MLEKKLNVDDMLLHDDICNKFSDPESFSDCSDGADTANDFLLEAEDECSVIEEEVPIRRPPSKRTKRPNSRYL